MSGYQGNTLEGAAASESQRKTSGCVCHVCDNMAGIREFGPQHTPEEICFSLIRLQQEASAMYSWNDAIVTQHDHHHKQTSSDYGVGLLADH